MKWLWVIGFLVPAILVAQAPKRPTGPNRYEFILDPGGKEKYVFDNNSGDLWKLVKDAESGNLVLREVLKEDASVLKLKEEKTEIKEEKILIEKKYKMELLRADSLQGEVEKLRAETDSLTQKAASDTTTNIRKVWKSGFYQKAAAEHRGIMDSLMVNNYYTLTRKDLKNLKSTIKAKEAKGIDQTEEKNIITVIEKYYKFPE